MSDDRQLTIEGLRGGQLALSALTIIANGANIKAGREELREFVEMLSEEEAHKLLCHVTEACTLAYLKLSGGSKEGLAHMLRDIGQSFSTALVYLDTHPEGEL